MVGPLQRVRYAGGVTEWHDLPRNTIDIRYSACGNHHLACDCREASLAEDIGEYRVMYRELETAILVATAGHATWAYDANGWDDEFAQCKCRACGIARTARIGFAETMRQRQAADEAADQAAAGRGRAWQQCPVRPGHPDYITADIEDVPF